MDPTALSTPEMGKFEYGLLRDKAFKLIKERSFIRERIKLVSGRESDFYFNMKATMFNPEAAHHVASLILARLDGLSVDYVGGLALGAVPLISHINILSHIEQRPIAGFFVRRAVKEHGTKQKIEGAGSLAGKRVVILDDVTTSGGSALIAVDEASNAGAKVVLVLSVVDREEGAAELYRERQLPFASLFKASEFLNA